MRITDTMVGASLVLAVQALIAAAGQSPASAPPGDGLDYEMFKAEIQPMFIAKRTGLVRCVQCHGRGAGTGGLLIVPPAERTTSWTEEQSRKNFDAVRRLVVPGNPDASRLLMHPLARDAGGDPFHGGGKHWTSKGDPEWQALARWVRAATPAAAGTSPAPRPLDFDYFKVRVQPLFLAKRSGLVRCTQCHTRGTGSGFALVPLAEGAAGWSDEQSRKNFESASRLVVPGEPTASRLLMHPLARSAGGDPFHGGGKHWNSQSDPEWQTLAAWVRGATTTSR